MQEGESVHLLTPELAGAAQNCKLTNVAQLYGGVSEIIQNLNLPYMESTQVKDKAPASTPNPPSTNPHTSTSITHHPTPPIQHTPHIMPHYASQPFYTPYTMPFYTPHTMQLYQPLYAVHSQSYPHNTQPLPTAPTLPTNQPLPTTPPVPTQLRDSTSTVLFGHPPSPDTFGMHLRLRELQYARS